MQSVAAGRNRFHVYSELCVRFNSEQFEETNGFRVAGRFRVLYEIITTICEQSAALAFIVLYDLCVVPDLLSVLVHCLCYQTGN
jgi:hypothetical protein